MNQVTLKGRLTRDPEIKYSQANNIKIANINIAVNRRFAKQGEERQADFFNCIAFSNTADFLEKYFKKGQEILLTGRIENRSWEDENGTKKYATDIMIEQVEFCGTKAENTQSEENTEVVENNDGSDDLPF